MRKTPDNQYRTPSVFLYTIFVFTLLIKLINIKKIKLYNMFWHSFLISAGAFFILTRMHERYFAPALPFLILLSYKNKKLSAICILASAIHLLNMYHWWWYPSLPPIVHFLSSISALYFLSSIFTIIFIYLVYDYFKQPTE